MVLSLEVFLTKNSKKLLILTANQSKLWRITLSKKNLTVGKVVDYVNVSVSAVEILNYTRRNEEHTTQNDICSLYYYFSLLAQNKPLPTIYPSYEEIRSEVENFASSLDMIKNQRFIDMTIKGKRNLAFLGMTFSCFYLEHEINKGTNESPYLKAQINECNIWTFKKTVNAFMFKDPRMKKLWQKNMNRGISGIISKRPISILLGIYAAALCLYSEETINSFSGKMTVREVQELTQELLVLNIPWRENEKLTDIARYDYRGVSLLILYRVILVFDSIKKMKNKSSFASFFGKFLAIL